MTRFIDADAVEKVLTDLYIKRPLDSDRWVIAEIKKGIMDLPTIDAVTTEFVMENCNLDFICDELTDDGEWCSEQCQYSEPQPECIHRYIDRIWRTEHDRKAIDEEIERAWEYAKTD